MNKNSRSAKPTANLQDFEPLSDKKLRKQNCLPPGQRTVKHWPILSVENTPEFDGKHWKLKVDGLIANPTEWSWQDLLELPKVEQTSDLHCVTGWSLFSQRFSGIAFKTIVDIVKPKPEAKFVTFEAIGGYDSALPLSGGYLDEPDVLFAYEHECKPLSIEHGGPLRLLVPQLYLWKSVKWVTQVHFLDEWERGFWEQRGYHQRGDPWLEERYSSEERPRRRDFKL